ncbi:MAG: hypothetical protein AMXMBFR36_01390 [Acidobacteriota bacterium]
MIGRTLGQYRILERLGTGGMGDVWLAEDTRLRRKVALKMLRREVAESPEKSARFEREAKAVAALSHPSIVTLHAVEEIDGVRFLAMEYLEGRTLDQVVRDGALPVGEILRIGVAVADALAAAHARGILHRDLKPSNVMVGVDGRVKVLDFGLAKLVRGDGLLAGGHETALTREGEVVGTLHYSSPEQLQLKPLDARSDVYSLGALLFEISTGAVPFRGDSTAQIVTEILCDPPRRLDELDRRLPPELADLVAACLEKEPARRPATAVEARDRLAALARALEAGHRASVGARVRRFARNARRGPALPLATAVAALVLAIVAVPWAVRELRGGKRRTLPGVAELAQAPAIAVLPFANPGGAPDYFVEGMADGVLGALARRGGVRIVSRQSSLRYRESTKPLAEIARELGVDLLVTGSVEREGETVRLEARLLDPEPERQLWSGVSERPLPAAIDLHEEAAAAIASAAGVDAEAPRTPARRVEPAAYEAYLQARYWAGKFGEEDLLKAKGYFERSIALDSSFAPAWSGLADALIMLGLFHVDSEDPLAHAEAAARRALELDPASADAHSALSDIAASRWQWTQSEQLVRRALELDASSASAHRRYWLLIAPQKRYSEARAAIERAKQIDPLSAQITVDLGVQELLEGRHAEAEVRLREAFEIDPDYRLVHAFLWAVYADLEKDPERGRELGLYLETFGYSAEVLRFREILGREGYEPALSALALDLDRKYRGNLSHLSVVPGLLAEAGHFDRALDWLERGVERRYWSLAWMPVVFDLRNLHGDERFERLIARLGLPETGSP